VEFKAISLRSGDLNSRPLDPQASAASALLRRGPESLTSKESRMPDTHGNPRNAMNGGQMAVRRIAELSELEGLALHTGRHLVPFCWSSFCCRSVLSCSLSDSAEQASFRIGSPLLMPIGMAGIAASLQYPVALVLSGSPFGRQLRVCQPQAAKDPSGSYR
jgi:hypothetical protein